MCHYLISYPTVLWWLLFPFHPHFLPVQHNACAAAAGQSARRFYSIFLAMFRLFMRAFQFKCKSTDFQWNRQRAFIKPPLCISSNRFSSHELVSFMRSRSCIFLSYLIEAFIFIVQSEAINCHRRRLKWRNEISQSSCKTERRTNKPNRREEKKSPFKK